MIEPRSPQTQAAVAAHYDSLDLYYRDIWGDHVHHGFWRTGRETPEAAADALVELVAERLGLKAGQTVCDIGCGYGATAAALAEAHEVSVTGITLSPAQYRLAVRRAPERGEVTFLLGDWLRNGLPDGAFDRAYAIESTEHMADKARCFAEAGRVLRPGGKLVVCAWLAPERTRPWQVRHLLEPICREGRLPSMGTAADYSALMQAAGFRPPAVDDITRSVARTWSVCLRRGVGRLATDRRYLRLLLDSTAPDRVFALTMVRLLVALRTGTMRYAVLTANKPE